MSAKLCTACTNDEAVKWPLPEVTCSECYILTGTKCGYCGEALCNHIPCIQQHSEKGCKWE